MKKWTMWMGIYAVFVCLLLITTGQAYAAKEFITVSTATTGGSTFVKYSALANVWNQYISEIKATAVPSSGCAENNYLWGEKKSDAGHACPGVFSDAYYGKKIHYTGKKIDFMTHMFNAGSTNLHMCVIEGKFPNIKSPADFKGMKVGAGPPGGLPYIWLTDVTKAYGVGMNEMTLRTGPSGQLAKMLVDGNIDVLTAGHGIPASTFMSLGSSHKLRFIDIAPNMMEKIVKDHPYYWGNAVKAGQTPYFTHPVTLLAETMFFAIKNDVSEDVVYRMMKSMWKERKTLEAAHKEWKATLDQEEGMFWPRSAPLHPGAVKFYKELGFTDKELETGKITPEKKGTIKNKVLN